MCAAENRAPSFDSVPDNAALTVAALRRESVNGAFEGIEVVGDAVGDNFQWFIVFVAAHLAGLDSGVQFVFGFVRQFGFQNARRGLVFVAFNHAASLPARRCGAIGPNPF